MPFFCGLSDDSRDLFIECEFAFEIWSWILNWCGIRMQIQNTWEGMVDEIGKHYKNSRNFLQAVLQVTCWFIRKARNEVVFRKKKKRRPATVVDEIQVNLFNWVRLRGKVAGLEWYSWCCSPFSSGSCELVSE